MKKFILIFIIFFTTMLVSAQVGIGTTTPRAALEIESDTTGILIPRIALTETNVQAPVDNPQVGALVEGTMVYNTNTAGTSPNNVYPGHYSWIGSEWIRLESVPVLNPSQIVSFGKFYINNVTVTGNSTLTLIVTDANCTITSNASLNWADYPVQGPGPPAFISLISIDNTAAEDGQWTFVITNSNTADITGSLSLMAFY